MAAEDRLVEDRCVRTPTFVTIVVAGGSALALGGIALGVANAVPNTPPPAYVDHYLEDLRALPPPADSAQIIREATGGTIPAAPESEEADDHEDEPTSTVAGSGHDDESVEQERERREDRSGPSNDSGHDEREDRSGPSDGRVEDRDDRDDEDPRGSRSGSGRGRDHPEDG